ncbi:LuxR C-terminal-related transcriptional regulator [Nonomuraea sp. NBC_00507]
MLTLMAQDQGNADIAEQLMISDNAVHKHIGSITKSQDSRSHVP